MRKLLGLLAVLVLAGSASAGVVLTIDNPVYNMTTDVMYVDLVVASNDGLTDSSIIGFGASLYLTGGDASQFTAITSPLQRTSEAGVGSLVAGSGQTYAWSTFTGRVTASAVSGGSPVANFGAADDSCVGVTMNSLTPGTVVARFYFSFTGPLTDLKDTLATASQDYATPGDGSSPTFYTNQFAQPGATVNNQGASMVPEPATMGLLGFGLAGLAVASRRKRKISR